MITDNSRCFVHNNKHLNNRWKSRMFCYHKHEGKNSRTQKHYFFIWCLKTSTVTIERTRNKTNELVNDHCINAQFVTEKPSLHNSIPSILPSLLETKDPQDVYWWWNMTNDRQAMSSVIIIIEVHPITMCSESWPHRDENRQW